MGSSLVKRKMSDSIINTTDNQSTHGFKKVRANSNAINYFSRLPVELSKNIARNIIRSDFENNLYPNKYEFRLVCKDFYSLYNNELICNFRLPCKYIYNENFVLNKFSREIYKLFNSSEAKKVRAQPEHIFNSLFDKIISNKIGDELNTIYALNLVLSINDRRPSLNKKNFIYMGLLGAEKRNDPNLEKMISKEYGAWLYKILPELLTKDRKFNLDAILNIALRDSKNPMITWKDMEDVGLIVVGEQTEYDDDQKNLNGPIENSHGLYIYKHLPELLMKGQKTNKKGFEDFLKISGEYINEEDGNLAIIKAYKNNKKDVVEKMLKSKFFIEAKNDDGVTPLLSICYNKEGDANFELAKYLIDNGADVNCEDNNKITPLNAVNGVKIAQYLIEKGAIIDKEDYQKNTPLLMAVARGNMEMTELLLDNKADIDHGDDEGKTPIMTSIEIGWPEIVKYLIERGANLEKEDKYGNTPIMYSVYEDGNDDMMRLLIDNKANINHVNKAGQTLLSLVVENKNKKLDTLVHLIGLEADVDIENDEGLFLRDVLRDYLVELPKGEVPSGDSTTYGHL